MPAIISAQNISSIIIFMDKWVCFMLIPRKNQKAIVLLFIYTILWRFLINPNLKKIINSLA